MTVKKEPDESEAILIESFERLSTKNETNGEDLCKRVIDELQVLIEKNDVKWKNKLKSRSPGDSYLQSCPQTFLSRTDRTVYFNINGHVFPLSTQMSDDEYLIVANSEDFKSFVETTLKSLSKREPRRDSSDSGISSEGIPSPDVKNTVENLKKSLDPQIKTMHWVKVVSMDLDELFCVDTNKKSLLHYAVESKIDYREIFYCVFTRMKKYPERFEKFFTDELKDSIAAILQKRKHYDLLDFFEEAFNLC